MKIFKEKLPDKIVFERKNDGIYEVTYTGVAVMDENENIFQNVTATIPNCVIDYNETMFGIVNDMYRAEAIPIPAITSIRMSALKDVVKFENIKK